VCVPSRVTISGAYTLKYYVHVTVYAHGSRHKALAVFLVRGNTLVDIQSSVSRLEQSISAIHLNIHIKRNFF